MRYACVATYEHWGGAFACLYKWLMKAHGGGEAFQNLINKVTMWESPTKCMVITNGNRNFFIKGSLLVCKLA